MSNIVRQSIIVLGSSGVVGWLAMKSISGTDEDMYKQYGEKDNSIKKSYDERTMMMEVLKRGGNADLKSIREETSRVRNRIAEDHTVYNLPVKETEEDTK